MKIINTMKKNKLLVFVILSYFILFFAIPQKAMQSIGNSMYYVKEMLQIMPVILILTSLIEAWVPKETIIKSFGEGSGIKGSILSLVLGSISAGPIYAAFPVTKMLLSKGASISNIVIILSSWAVIKVPMLANETKFLGARFAVTRWILTTTAIFIMAYIISKIVKKEDISMNKDKGNNLSIKKKYCIGCGICTKLAPDIFKLDNNKAQVVMKVAKGETTDSINKSIERCPTKAIYWE